MKFVNPKNDVAFKKIFGSEDKTEVLIGFLNAVLDLHGEYAIQRVRIRNPYQTPKLALQKQTILDIYATDNRGFTFIVEMQVANVASAIRRFHYYVAKEYASQIGPEENHASLMPIIFVGICDFILFKGSGVEGDIQTAIAERYIAESDIDIELIASKREYAYLSCHKFMALETREDHLKNMTFYFIELPKFTKSEDQLIHVLDKWIYFIKHAGTLDIIPSHVQQSELQTAYTLADQLGWEQDEREQYEYRSIKMQDERGAIQFAWEEGLEKGRRERDVMLKVANNMLSLALPIEQIMAATSLSAEQIQALES